MTASHERTLLLPTQVTSPAASADRKPRWIVAGCLLATTIVLSAMGMSGIASDAANGPYAEIMSAFRATSDFDGVVQIRENNRTLFADHSGLASEEHKAPIVPNSIFPVASNSKLFTSVALYQLQERGLVNLTDAVNDWLGQEDFAAFGFPNQTRWCPRLYGAAADSPCERVTFIDLLFMGSGIGDSANCDNVDAAHCYQSAEDLAYYKGSIGVYVGRFINDPLVFRPGTNYSYANPNFVLLAYFVEKISGEAFGAYLQRAIFDPLELRDTYYDPYSGALGIREGYLDEYQHFYVESSSSARPERIATGTCSPFVNSGAISGSGGVRSTVGDMQRWYMDLFHRRGQASKVLTAKSIHEIVTRRNPVSREYAQGVGVGFAEGNDEWPSDVTYCGGTKCSVTCMHMHIPNRETSMIVSVFSNHMHLVFADRGAFERYRPATFFAEPEDSTLVQRTDAGGAMSLVPQLLAAYQNSRHERS